MKKNNATKFIALLLVAMPLVALGQATLHGVVTDSLTNEKLIGINVILEGTSLGASTDIEGAYRVSAIPPRTFTIKVSCVGYETKMFTVDFSNKTEVQLNVPLHQTILQGQAVVITAQMRGQVAAINEQVSSKTIVNVVSEEKIKELPDANAAEAIGRLPGVSLIRSGGEATKIVLRGLSSKFSNITVDGVKIPSTDSTSRDVDLSMISQGELAGIELYKTITPDQDGDAIAGAVNFVTRKAPSERTIIFNLLGDYNRLMKSGDQYDLSGRYGQRFFDDVLGVQIQGNVEKRIRSKEDITYSYEYYKDINNPGSTTNVDYRMAPFTVDFTDEDRTRNGGQVIFDVNTPDSGSVKLSGLYSSTGINSMLYDRVYPGITGGGGSWDYNYRYTQSTTSTTNASLQGKNYLGGFDIDWNASYAHSRVDNPYDFAMKFTEVPGVGPSGIPSGRDHPELYIIPFALNDFSAAACSTSVYYQRNNFDRERTAYVDLTKTYNVFDQLSGELKFGGKYRDRSRWLSKEELDDNNYLHGFSADGVDTTRMEDSRFANYYYNRTSSSPSLSDFIDYPAKSRDLLGLYKMTPLISPDAMKLWYDLVKNATVNGDVEFGSSALAELADYDVRERVGAGYVMNTFNIGQAVTLIAGVRLEEESDDYGAKFTDGAISTIGIRQNSPNPIQDSTTHYSENVWLPNAQLAVKLTDYLKVRAAAYRQLARPDYNFRLPTFNISGNGGQTFDLGNPNLKDTKAWNYELNTQVFDNTVGLISVSGFYKVIDDLYHEMNSVSVDAVDSLFGALGMTWQNTAPFKSIIDQRSIHSLTVPYNSDKKSYVWGFEFDHQMNFGFLPGYLSNITLSYNLSITRSETYIIGSQTIATSETTIVRGKPVVSSVYHHVPVDLKRESEGQPNLYGNAALGYDIGGFSARVSVFMQDEYVQQYSSDGQSDVYVDPFTKWDLALKQRLNDTFSLLLNINNFTNRQEKTSIKDNVVAWQIPRTAELYGTTVDFGVRVTL
ncbi:MAG TPA: TonB-dependent receptor [Bacteroidota bacterium]|nr:TonB-dependent receptor [Bacteroidota bacterium]